MNEKILPEKTILNFLEETSPLAWGRTQTRTDKQMVNGRWIDRDYLKYPPYISFRFQNEDSRLIKIIEEAVETFKGNVVWLVGEHKRIDLPGINRSILPKKLEEVYEIAAQKKMSADDYLAKYEPELGSLAYDDLPKLAEYIRKVIAEKYHKSTP